MAIESVETVTVTIDDTPDTVTKGTLVIEAARRVAVMIPTVRPAGLLARIHPYDQPIRRDEGGVSEGVFQRPDRDPDEQMCAMPAVRSVL